MISIICPYYNEKDNLEELYQRLLKTAAELPAPLEIIFVNDGSNDGGGEFLDALIQGQSSIRHIHLDRNYGLTTALYAGLQAAKGEILASLDADLQNPPEEILKMVCFLEQEKADIVVGIRTVRHDSFVRRVSSKIANAIRREVLRDSIVDIGCALRVFRRETLRVFYPYKSMHRFFAALAEREGFKIKQISVDHEPRKRGLAKFGVRNRMFIGLWDLLSIRWLISRKISYQIRKG